MACCLMAPSHHLNWCSLSSVTFCYRPGELTIPLSWANKRVSQQGVGLIFRQRSHWFRGVCKRSIQKARMTWHSLAQSGFCFAEICLQITHAKLQSHLLQQLVSSNNYLIQNFDENYLRVILTHLPLVLHICVIIDSVTGLSLVWRQAITWTNAGLLSIGLLCLFY